MSDSDEIPELLSESSSEGDSGSDHSDNDEDFEDPPEPVKSEAEQFKEEGNQLFTRKEYPQAIERYRRALECTDRGSILYLDVNKHILYCNSSKAMLDMYEQQGGHPDDYRHLEQALKSAELSMDEKPEFLRAHLRKAQILTAMGDASTRQGDPYESQKLWKQAQESVEYLLRSGSGAIEGQAREIERKLKQVIVIEEAAAAAAPQRTEADRKRDKDEKKKTIKRMQAANREALTSEDGNNIRAAMEQASEWLQPNDKTMQACRTWLAKLSEDSKQVEKRLRDATLECSHTRNGSSLHAALDAAYALIQKGLDKDDTKSLQVQVANGEGVLQSIEKDGKKPEQKKPEQKKPAAKEPASQVSFEPPAKTSPEEMKRIIEEACETMGVPKHYLEEVIQHGIEEDQEIFYIPTVTMLEKEKQARSGWPEAVHQALEHAPPLKAQMKVLGHLDNTLLAHNGLDELQISEIEEKMTGTQSGTVTFDHPQEFTKLEGRFGHAVMSEVKRAWDEIQEHNASGGYSVEKAWNRDEDRELRPREVLDIVSGYLQKQNRKIVELQAKLDKLTKGGNRRR